MRRRTLFLLIFLVVLAIAGLLVWQFLLKSRESALGTAPPRAEPGQLPPPAVSSIALPVRVPLALLEKALNDAVPVTLWQIDQPGAVCAAPTRVKLLGVKLKVTPTIKCRIVGEVTRGPIRLSGKKGKLQVLLPVSASFAAKDVGGLIKRTGTQAEAVITAVLLPRLQPDGHLSARLQLTYDWRKEPEIKVLGRNIRLTEKADEKLAPILAKIETELPRRLARLPIKAELEKLWQQGFTVEALNRQNPPAWLRLTPQTLGVSTIVVESRTLKINARLGALAEVVLGDEPQRPTPTRLPRIGIVRGQPGLQLSSFVLADPATLQRPIDKALAKVAAKGIPVPDVGRIKVRFGPSTLYATTGGRLALGLEIMARGPRQVLDTRGKLWLTARPETAPDSEKMQVRDIRLVTSSDEDVQLPLIVAVAQSAEVQAALEEALAQDFTRDYTKLLGKVDKALAAVRIGDFRLNVKLNEVRHDQVLVMGQGLYLPVTATGRARLDYAPRPR
jgi:hypothetical protein